MGIAVRQVRGVYYLSGELDWEGGEDLRVAMRPGPEGVRELVLDLSDVTFMDSMGVRALVLVSRKRWGGLVLRNPQDAVVRVLELLQIDEMPGIRVELE